MAAPFIRSGSLESPDQSARFLRNRLLWALAASGLGLYAGCGDNESAEGRSQSQRDEDGQDLGAQEDASTHTDGDGDGEGNVVDTDASTSTTGGDGGLKAYPELVEREGCYDREPEARCLGDEALRHRAKYGTTFWDGSWGEEPPQLSGAEIDALFLSNGCLPKEYVWEGCGSYAVSDGAPDGDDGCCYLFCNANSVCGRPFLVDRSPRLPELERRRDWSASTWSAKPLDASLLSAELKRHLARAWREDARMEYASVAAFARFTLELIGFGAPADLILRSQRAGLDEIRHAGACFAMAERFEGESLGPAPMPVHDASPGRSLRESVLCALVEGCIGETLAAARAQAAARRARCPAALELWKQIADDEAEHAELSWRFVAWALRREPALQRDVREAFARSMGELTAVAADAPARSELSVEERELASAFGRLSEDEERAVARSTALDVIAPCAAALLGGRTAAVSVAVPS